MQRIWSVDMPAHVGERVVLAGWLHRLRRLSSVTFLIVRDGQGLAQIVLDAPAQAELLDGLPPESVVRVEGELLAAPQAPRGVELRAAHIEVLEAALEPPPFELHRPQIPAQLPTLLDHAAVSLRHPRQRALWRLAAVSAEGFRKALSAERFTEVFTPQARGHCHRRRRQRFRRRLLRSPRVPRAEPAVLQADAGGRLRARL